MKLAVVLLWMGSLGSAHATLAPRSPADVVQLNTDSSPCGNQNTGHLFRNRAVDSGTGVGISSFTMPKKHVLVVTQAEIVVQGGTPGSFVQLRFYNGGGSGGGTEYGIVSTAYDSGGSARASFSFPTGVIIRSIENLCADLSFGNGSVLGGVLHGFLVKGQ